MLKHKTSAPDSRFYLNQVSETLHVLLCQVQAFKYLLYNHVFASHVSSKHELRRQLHSIISVYFDLKETWTQWISSSSKHPDHNLSKYAWQMLSTGRFWSLHHSLWHILQCMGLQWFCQYSCTFAPMHTCHPEQPQTTLGSSPRTLPMLLQWLNTKQRGNVWRMIYWIQIVYWLFIRCNV